jgi:hypothetical protein
MVPNIEPSLPPALQTSQKFVGDVLLFHPLPQLESNPTDLIHFVLTRLRFEMEKVAKKIEMGFYPQESFAEMDKYGNVKNQVGVQMVKLNTIIEKKAVVEIRNRKGQGAFNKILK